MAITKGFIVKGFAGLATVCGTAWLGGTYYKGKDSSLNVKGKDNSIANTPAQKEAQPPLKTDEKVVNEVNNKEVKAPAQPNGVVSSTGEKKVEGADSSREKQPGSSEVKPPEQPSVDQGNDQKASGATVNQPQNVAPQPPQEDLLGLPADCKPGGNPPLPPPDDQSVSCDLTEEQFKKINFVTKDNSSITVTGITETNKVNLKIGFDAGSSGHTSSKKYTFKSTSSEIKINGIGDGEIVITKDQEVSFRKKGTENKLEKITE